MNRYYSPFIEAIFRETLLLLEKELGVLEADESCFGIGKEIKSRQEKRLFLVFLKGMVRLLCP